jgi:hypothetical protein
MNIMNAAGSSTPGPLQLDPAVNPAAAQILANPPPDTGGDVLGQISMTMLLR